MASLPARIVAYLILGIFCGVGPLLLLFVAGTGIRRALFVHSSLSAEGVIVGLRATRFTSSSKNSWSPIFRFTAKDGGTFTVTSDVAEGRSHWRLGASVPVLYEQAHPENAHINSFFQLWALQAILGTVGAAFSALPFLILVRRLRANA